MSDALNPVFTHKGLVSTPERERLNGHHGCIVWLTGMSASGKSTIACELEVRLIELGFRPYVLDGDNLRHGLCRGLGFSEADRNENIRRIGEVARLFADAGFICIVAAISPYRHARDRVRSLVPEGRFIEVHVHAPIEILEKRDYKGLYTQARAQKISNFTGISAPYEAPLSPEVDLATDELTVFQSVNKLTCTIVKSVSFHSNLPVTLRPESADDRSFLLEVYSSTREEEMRLTGWAEDLKKTFLASQFEAMTRSYLISFPTADRAIIELDKKPVGRLVVDRNDHEIRLVDIALLAEYRNRGIGTFLVRELQLESLGLQKAVELQVFQGNLAIRAYRRLGFKPFDGSGMHIKMRWTSGGSSDTRLK